MCDYTMGLGQLLLRSSKNSVNKTNIDIVFFDTTFVQVYWNLDGIKISDISPIAFNDYKSVNDYLKKPGSHLFQLESQEERYLIAASFIKIYENNLHFNVSSLGLDEQEKGTLIGKSS